MVFPHVLGGDRPADCPGLGPVSADVSDVWSARTQLRTTADFKGHAWGESKNVASSVNFHALIYSPSQQRVESIFPYV